MTTAKKHLANLYLFNNLWLMPTMRMCKGAMEEIVENVPEDVNRIKTMIMTMIAAFFLSFVYHIERVLPHGQNSWSYSCSYGAAERCAVLQMYLCTALYT